MTDRARFDVHVKLPTADILKAGECALEETAGRLTRFGFRYESSYAEQQASFPLDPAQLPLANWPKPNGLPSGLTTTISRRQAWMRWNLLSWPTAGRTASAAPDPNRCFTTTLAMARAADIDAAKGTVLAGVNGREILLLERFDVAPNGGRFHLITANGLLKDPSTQQDPGHSFRYDDIRNLVSRYSIDPEKDLKQLLKLMLFNRCIHNTDDHERNFSLINRGEGFRLSPAYDLLPSLSYGEYHAAGFEYRGDPPTPSEVVRLGRVFGLSKPTVANCAEQVGTAVSAWPIWAGEAGVSEEDMEKVQQRLIL